MLNLGGSSTELNRDSGKESILKDFPPLLTSFEMGSRFTNKVYSRRDFFPLLCEREIRFFCFYRRKEVSYMKGTRKSMSGTVTGRLRIFVFRVVSRDQKGTYNPKGVRHGDRVYLTRDL